MAKAKKKELPDFSQWAKKVKIIPNPPDSRTVFFSCGAKPLANWKVVTKGGFLQRITDEDIKSLVIEIIGNNVANTYIISPCCPSESLSINKPIMVMLVKNLQKYFSFQLTAVDDRQQKRRFRCSTYLRKMSIQDSVTFMPMTLQVGWNQIHFDLSTSMLAAYKTHFVELSSLVVHANCRLRRVYFTDRLYKQEELPPDYKLIMA